MSSSHDRHHRSERTGALCVLTVSDTRTVETDTSGQTVQRLLEQAGHRVLERAIVRDEPEQVSARVAIWIDRRGCDGVVVNGGTGISPRDRTYEAISCMLQKRIDGFGELFRMLSYQEIGSAAMLSRALGGVIRGKLIFSVPGSTPAVELALNKLILPELGHLLAEMEKHA